MIGDMGAGLSPPVSEAFTPGGMTEVPPGESSGMMTGQEPPLIYNPNVIFGKGQREELAHLLEKEISAAMTANADLHAKIGEWNKQYEGIRPAKTEPWPGCANIHIPLTGWHVRTANSQLCQTILGCTPIVRIEPRGAEDEERARNWEAWLQYLAERRLGLRGKLKEIIMATLKHGTGIAKLTLARRKMFVKQVQPMNTPDDPPIIVEREVSDVGPRLDYVPLRDFVLVPAEARSIAEAVGMGDRRYVRLDYIRKQEAQGVFDEGIAAALEDAPGMEEPETETHTKVGIKPNQNEGKSFNKFEHWEYIRSLPLRYRDGAFHYDPDGDERDCLVDLIIGQGEGGGAAAGAAGKALIARCILYPWMHGRRHYIPFRVFPREGQFHGESQVEMLKDLNDEIDTEHNMRLDWGSLVLRRPYVKRRGARITDAQGRTRIKFQPGAVIDVEEPGDGAWMEIPDSPPSSFREEEMGVDYAEHVDGITQAKVGRTEPGRKTLGEVEIVEQQGNVRFDDMVEALQGIADYEEGNGLRELYYQLMGLTIQFATPQETFRVLGPYGNLQETMQLIMPTDMEEIVGGYDFTPEGNTISSNMHQQREDAVLLYRELLQNPLVMGNPTLIYKITKMFLTRYGEKNWREMIGEEQETVGMFMQAQQQAALEEQEADGGDNAGREGGGYPEDIAGGQGQFAMAESTGMV